ncbi:T9SS type A sorting domain-containing protein, partial [Tenacibaculum sp. S7007]
LSFVYEVEQPDELEVSIEEKSIISCQGSNDGVLQAKPIGGVLPYKYEWYKEGSTVLLGDESELASLENGVYYVKIIDANNNKVSSSRYTLTEPELLELFLESDYVLCGTGNDWTIESIVKGGTAPYTYLWSTGTNTVSLQGVKAGSYMLTVVDANGCKVTSEKILTPPSPIIINDVDITNPTCYQGNDGKIKILVEGGTPTYEYIWSNGLKGSSIGGISAGEYEVLIRDSKGCTYSKSFEIKNPEELKLDLGEDVTLCKDQSYILDATLEKGVKYEWTSSNGFSSTNSEVEITDEGIYKVIVTTGLGCIVTDEIEIKQSDAEVSANYLVSSQVYTNESFVLVNVSDPKPEEVTWIFPEKAKVIIENNNYAEILIEEEGEYEVTLISKVGDCEEYITKRVLVLEKTIEEEEEENLSNNQVLSSILLYPNPSSGEFNLDIELKNINTINVKIYRLNSTMVLQKEYSGKDIYELDYNLSLVSGVYFALIETKEERIIKKIVIR